MIYIKQELCKHQHFCFQKIFLVNLSKRGHIGIHTVLSHIFPCPIPFARIGQCKKRRKLTSYKNWKFNESALCSKLLIADVFFTLDDQQEK